LLRLITIPEGSSQVSHPTEFIRPFLNSDIPELFVNAALIALYDGSFNADIAVALIALVPIELFHKQSPAYYRASTKRHPAVFPIGYI
jgi:hypothetical protein